MGLTLGSNIELLVEGEDVRVPFAGKYGLRVLAQQTPPQEDARYLRRIALELDAFPSASEAERAGKLLTVSVLWFAAVRRATIGFRKRTGDYPFAVRDRALGLSLQAHAEGRAYYSVTPEELGSIAEEAFAKGTDVTPDLLVSMEFFAAADLEATERARFVALMTALEALAVQEDHGVEVAELLKDLADRLIASDLMRGEDQERLRTSLESQVLQLRRESVRQAILRTLRELSIPSEDVRFVDHAYGIRCKILHEGFRTSHLGEVMHRLKDVLRRVYSILLDLPLPEAG